MHGLQNHRWLGPSVVCLSTLPPGLWGSGELPASKDEFSASMVFLEQGLGKRLLWLGQMFLIFEEQCLQG